MTQSMEAKIMKYHVLSWSLSFFTNLLLPEQVKKLVYSVNESAHFYLTWPRSSFIR